MNKIKGDISLRNRLLSVYFLFLLVAFGVMFKAVKIQTVEGDKLMQSVAKQTMGFKDIEPVRGNIYAENWDLLATSMPFFEIRWDPNADYLSEAYINENATALAKGLQHILKDKSAQEYKQNLLKARKSGDRYYLIAREVDYNQLLAIKKLPIFEMGRYKGGLIYMQKSKRVKPFGQLAARTIGYDISSVGQVGIEGAYSQYLAGIRGKRLMKKISGGVWMPLRDENDIEPKDGFDVVSTLDINLQDVAEQALRQQLVQQQADHGCVVLMEVSTGEVKAIANLTRGENGTYWENYNYAIGESTEPGSTIKLASLMIALEDGLVDLSDSVDTEDGQYKMYDATIRDSKKGGYGKITVQRAFELSSNIGIAKIIQSNYGANPDRFVKGLKKIGLDQSLGLKIAGEGKPYIKSPENPSWSGISLPWMSFGYEVGLTPLQILTLYNAVANNGVMVKPIFIKGIYNQNKSIEAFKPQIINKKICSDNTLAKLKICLQGVVDKGTASNLKNSDYKIAGKTGTVQIYNKKYGYHYESQVSHQASFVGYFPAENPKYSCIVVVNAPSNNVYYGNLVAGPIFKEVADKVYATRLNLIQREAEDFQQLAQVPYSKNGNRADLCTVFKQLDIPVEDKSESASWVLTKSTDKQVELLPKKISPHFMPNVKGMNAADAVYVLEKIGCKVELNGFGSVRWQSVTPGEKVQRKTRIKLELS